MKILFIIYFYTIYYYYKFYSQIHILSEFTVGVVDNGLGFYFYFYFPFSIYFIVVFILVFIFIFIIFDFTKEYDVILCMMVIYVTVTS